MDSPWFQTVYGLFMVENGCVPTSQGGPEIKYLLQGGMPEKGSHWLNPSGSPLAWRTVFWADVTCVVFPYVGSVTHVPCWESGRSRELSTSQVCTRVSGDSDLLHLTEFPGKVHRPLFVTRMKLETGY